MGTTKGQAYYDDDHHCRSYSRGNGYERDLPPTAGHGVYPDARGHHMSHEGRNGSHSSENDANSRPRSRIPVACGRCRKRKIRCSGDSGGPCVNCKNAGNEQCQFLRVSSQDLPMKGDPSSFEYDALGSAGSRLNCRMIPYGPYGPGTPLSIESYPYRNNSLSGYQFPVKPYYALPQSYAEFSEENVEYGIQTGLQTGSYGSIIGGDQVSIPSSYSTTRGTWAPAPQLPRQSLFLETESAYTHGQLPYPGNQYPLRPAPAINTESKGLVGLNSIAATLPTPLTGNDRVLPFPAANRPAQAGTTTSYLRATNLCQPGYPPYDGLMSAGMLNSIKSQNAASVSETGSLGSGYLPLSSNSPESLSSLSSQMSYGSQNIPLHQQSELCTHTPTSTESLYHSPPQITDPSSESAYGPSNCSISSKRGSHSSQSGAPVEEGALPPLTSGSLANGQHYVPHYNTSVPSTMPPTYVNSSSSPHHHHAQLSQVSRREGANATSAA